MDFEARPLTAEALQMLETTLTKRSRTREKEWLTAVGPGRLDLMEVCCPEDSPLSAEVEKQGGSVLPLGLHSGHDMSTYQGYRRARQWAHCPMSIQQS